MGQQESQEFDAAEALEALKNALPPFASSQAGKLLSKSKSLRKLALATATSPAPASRPRGDYAFDKLTYVRQLVFYGPDIAAIKRGLKVICTRIDGTEKEMKLLEVDKGGSTERCNCFPDAFVQKIHIEPRLARSPVLSRIEVTGYSLAELENIADKTEEALDLRTNIARFVADTAAEATSAKAERDSVQKDIALALVEKESLASEIQKLASVRAEAEEALAAVREVQAAEKVTLDDLRAKVQSAHNNKSQLAVQVDELNIKIPKLQSELQSLANDRSIISDEYRDYVKEGRSQAWVYIGIAVACLVGALACACSLIYAAGHYLANPVKVPSEAYAYFLQRLPFTGALILTITLLLKVASVLVRSIFKIHDARLTLAKLLVIAKDTVFASTAGLTLDDETRFRERVRLKIEMLKAYLAAELGPNFEPQLVDPRIDMETVDEETEGNIVAPRPK